MFYQLTYNWWLISGSLPHFKTRLFLWYLRKQIIFKTFSEIYSITLHTWFISVIVLQFERIFLASFFVYWDINGFYPCQIHIFHIWLQMRYSVSISYSSTASLIPTKIPSVPADLLFRNVLIAILILLFKIWRSCRLIVYSDVVNLSSTLLDIRFSQYSHHLFSTSIFSVSKFTPSSLNGKWRSLKFLVTALTFLYRSLGSLRACHR